MHNYLIHNRTRIPTKKLILLDKFILFLSFITPLTTLPQIIKLLITKSAENVSLITWFALFLITIPWIIYGVVHKIKPIIVLNILWLLFDLIMVILIFIY